MIAENIAMTGLALRGRLGIEASGFRAPGGFPEGLGDRRDLQEMLLSMGFRWVSSKYPPHTAAPAGGAAPAGKAGGEASGDSLEGILKAQEASQPFFYPSGMVEVPMSPPSDIAAFRNGRWTLDRFLKAVRAGVEWAIERGAAFDFLGHPSCLSAVDPKFQAVELIADLVREAGPRAALVDLGEIARAAGRTG